VIDLDFAPDIRYMHLFIANKKARVFLHTILCSWLIGGMNSIVIGTILDDLYACLISLLVSGIIEALAYCDRIKVKLSMRLVIKILYWFIGLFFNTDIVFTYMYFILLLFYILF